MFRSWWGGGAESAARPRDSALARATQLVRAALSPPHGRASIVEMSAEEIFHAVSQSILLALAPGVRERLTEVTAELFAAAAAEIADAARASEGAAATAAATSASFPTKDHVGPVAAHMRDVIYDGTRALYIRVPDAGAVTESLNAASREHDKTRVPRVLHGLVERAVEHARLRGTTVPFCVVELLPGEWRSVRGAAAAAADDAAPGAGNIELYGAARSIAEFCQRLAWSLETVSTGAGGGGRTLYVRLPDTRAGRGAKFGGSVAPGARAAGGAPGPGAPPHYDAATAAIEGGALAADDARV